MNKYLIDYLEQIDHYLSVQDGKKEILDEIPLKIYTLTCRDILL